VVSRFVAFQRLDGRPSVAARTNHDQPFWLLNTVFIPFGISQCLDFDVLGFLDLVCGSVADEDWLATPFDNDL
jgi:hypothetical protein